MTSKMRLPESKFLFMLVFVMAVVDSYSLLPSYRLSKKIYKQYGATDLLMPDLYGQSGEMPESGSGGVCESSFEEAKSITTRVANCLDTGAINIQFDSCCDLMFLRLQVDGIYPVRGELMYCDMQTDGGGWVVIQRRAGGMRSFDKHWRQYKHGFGVLDRDFWLGLQTIHQFTQQGPTELRVDMTLRNGTQVFAKYSSFHVDHEDNDYRLNISGFSEESTAGDGLSAHNGARFTTPDRDNDEEIWVNCGFIYESGWWFKSCVHPSSALNQPYVVRYHRRPKGVLWISNPQVGDISGENYALSVEMKLRPFKWECGNIAKKSTEELFLLKYSRRPMEPNFILSHHMHNPDWNV